MILTKTKTIPYKPKYNHYYFYSSRPKLDKKGLVKKRGDNIVLCNMSHCRSIYPELPNGRYYEYIIRDDFFLKNKQCKEYSFYDKKADHKQLVGVQIFEDIDPKYIDSQGLCFDVKGGVVKFKDLKGTNKNPTRNLKPANKKFMDFIEGHRRMKHLDVRSYFYFVELYNECQRLNIGIPYKAKDLISKVYSNFNNKKLQKLASDNFVSYKKETFREK